MFPFDPVNARVRVSTTEGGTYTSLGKVRSADYNEGTEGGSTLKYLGGQAKKAGDPTVSATLNMWWDNTDTTGQEVLKTAKRNGTTVFLQFCPEGTGTGDKVEQVGGLITELSIRLDAEGEAVEGSFTFDGDATTLQTVTLA